MKIIALVLLAFSSLAVHAAPPAFVRACGYLNSLDALVAGPKTYANGAIRVFHVTTEEPAAAADHLAVLVSDGEMGWDCYAISYSQDGWGYYGVNFAKIGATYDKSTGLTVSVPVRVYDGTQGVPAGKVVFRVDRSRPVGDQVVID